MKRRQFNKNILMAMASIAAAPIAASVPRETLIGNNEQGATLQLYGGQHTTSPSDIIFRPSHGCISFHPDRGTLDREAWLKEQAAKWDNFDPSKNTSLHINCNKGFCSIIYEDLEHWPLHDVYCSCVDRDWETSLTV